jgi:hypothetical protein
VIQYHPDAQAEFDVIFEGGGRGLRVCLGMAIKRNLRIDSGQEPLIPSELIGPGKKLSQLYSVSHLYGVFTEVEFVYEKLGSAVKVVALEAWQGGLSFQLPTPGSAQQRGYDRSA